MAKKRPEQKPPASSNAPMAILIAGGLIVAALVAWAVTRSMQAPTPSTVPAASQSDALPPPTASMPVQNPLQNPITTTFPQPPATSTVQEHTQSPEKAAVPRIEYAELRDEVMKGQVTVIDVRDSVSYSNGHIPGAMHIPFARIESELNFLPKNKPIVTYCT